jgi:hypothetical protein
MSFSWNQANLDKINKAAGQAVYEAAEHVLTEATKTVPHEEGILSGTGHTDVDRRDLKATVSYDTPYAARQHEEMGYAHNPGRRAKWLELTIKEEEKAIKAHMAKVIKGAI